MQRMITKLAKGPTYQITVVYVPCRKYHDVRRQCATILEGNSVLREARNFATTFQCHFPINNKLARSDVLTYMIRARKKRDE